MDVISKSTAHPKPFSLRRIPTELYLRRTRARSTASTLQRSMHRPPSRPRPFHEERRDEAAEGGRGDEDCPKFMTHKLIYTACRFYDKSAHCSSCQVQSVSAQKVRSRLLSPVWVHAPPPSPSSLIYTRTHSLIHSLTLFFSLSLSLCPRRPSG